MKYGKKIKQLLHIRGMTQYELAEKSGVSLSLISALANDRRESITDVTLEKIANALGVKVKYFFDDEVVIPLEILEERLSKDNLEFIFKEGSVDFLRLAMDFKNANISPEFVMDIVTHFKTMVDKYKT